MSIQNLPVINLRKSYRVKNEAALINGYRNAVFLPGIGRYKGMWKNNVREGLGTLTTKNGGIYEGNWMNDIKHGYGLLKKQVNSQRVQYEPIYDGEWKCNKRHGDGKAYYKNGFYEGQWKHNNRHGLGIMTYYDGSYYIGEWKNDLYDGIGAHKDVNRSTLYKGYFRNGVKCGEGVFNDLVKRKVQKGVWMDDVCVTSILQDDINNVNMTSLKGYIPEIGLANPVSVIKQSLQNKTKDNNLNKLNEKALVNFEHILK